SDPTKADPRLAATTVNAQGTVVPKYVDESGSIKMLPSFIFWCVFLFLFSYLGTILPIWRFAQPVNYIGFWVTFLTIGLSALGGSSGTARQLEYETDALPVGGGAMFSENTLALLSLIAVSIAGGAGGGAFAAGVGKLLGVVSFGAIPQAYGTALGFGAFVVIVLTVVQLVFRLMRVTLSEWLGDAWVGFKNPHIAALVFMVLALAFVMSGTWIYLWQLFGASNQLMAALSLLIVTLWLKSSGRNPS